MTWRTPAGVSPANRRTMSSLLRLVPASEIAPAEWDRLVEASPDGWVFALSGWQRLIVRVTAWDLREMSVGVYHEDALVAVMPLQYQAASRRLSSSGWGLTGPVVSASVEPALRAEVLARCLDHCKTVAGTLRATAIDIGRMAATRTAMADRDTDVLVSLGFADTSTDSMVIDLAPSEEELWARLSKNARQMVRKAEAAGYRVALCDWREYLDAYYSVHSETYTRTGVPPHPRAYFEGIANEMAPSGHAALWAGFGPNGDAVAFHNDARLGPGALYHTGCSRTAHLESGINYLLMWEAIRGAKREGRHWYEVGEVFPGAEGKSRGLTVFKSKFGGSPRRFIKGHLDLPAHADSGESTDAAMRAAYSSGALYATATICRTVSEGATEYVERLLEQKVAEVRRHYTAGVVVDLCCASGAHVLELAPAVQRAVGIDFSERYLIEGQSQARAGSLGNVAFVQGDARAVPMASGSVQLLYCFSALYAIPRAADVVAEAGRVLADGGYAVLDFGNRRSLNVFCLRYYTEWPAPHPLTLGEIAEALRRAGLEVVTHRRFQLLPLWADRPSWLWPLLHPAWKRVMKTDLGGRMLDEWVSSLPLLRRFAFRHLIVCRKALMGARG